MSTPNQPLSSLPAALWRVQLTVIGGTRGINNDNLALDNVHGGCFPSEREALNSAELRIGRAYVYKANMPGCYRVGMVVSAWVEPVP